MGLVAIDMSQVYELAVDCIVVQNNLPFDQIVVSTHVLRKGVTMDQSQSETQ